ncbi:type II toxin-antitoxin system RelE/ParE family toxin [Pseudomonas sp. UBA1879]|uniref:type II toxin-antitoxin system RelE/ParE family toxin n=1 Tax=Pseudomonas sp. UBA1879 TaxID=1947305 RepID=UPI0025E554D8|nr:type II toxin-antitoxin system RelE/ParE family toxin [Pseudomonas sp. UBA1879]
MLNRVFKTKGFAVTASNAKISDAELCAAIREVWKGQADDLGGGIWKKRLNRNRHRSIILAKGRSYWIYQFLFAKQAQSNISKNELHAFRKLAKAYEGLNAVQIQQLLDRRDFTEICHGEKI